MKSFFVAILALVFVTNTAMARTCRAEYVDIYNEQYNTRDGLAIAELASPFVFIGIFGAAGVLMVGAVVAAGAVGVSELIRYGMGAPDKMVALIDESYDYLSRRGMAVNGPGKMLKKLHKKLKNEEITIEQLAESIVKGNEDGSLCNSSTNIMRPRDLKKAINRGEVRVINLDEEEAPKDVLEEALKDETNCSKDATI